MTTVPIKLTKHLYKPINIKWQRLWDQKPTSYFSLSHQNKNFLLNTTGNFNSPRQPHPAWQPFSSSLSYKQLHQMFFSSLLSFSQLESTKSPYVQSWGDAVPLRVSSLFLEKELCLQSVNRLEQSRIAFLWSKRPHPKVKTKAFKIQVPKLIKLVPPCLKAAALQFAQQ